jgi:hypothetical protein
VQLRVEISHGPHHFLNKTPTLHQRIFEADYAVTENVENYRYQKRRKAAFDDNLQLRRKIFLFFVTGF